MTVFGSADFWIQAAAPALVEALRDRVHWHKLAAGTYFVPSRIGISSVKTQARKLDLSCTTSNECKLSFITPLDTERTEIANNPHQVLKKLLIRVALMVCWQNTLLSDNLDALFTDWKNLKCEFVGSVHTSSLRLDSGRNRQTGFRDVTMSELEITGDLGSLWPFLLIGETTYIGRGAVNGLGRYKILVN